MSSVSLSSDAYILPLLHAARHPSSAVLGLLVAATANDPAIDEAIPLLHHWTTLTPAAESGIEVARRHVAPAAGQARQIVGVYAANARVDDLSLGIAQLGIAKELARTLKRPAIALVVRPVSVNASESSQIDPTRLAKGEQTFIVRWS